MLILGVSMSVELVGRSAPEEFAVAQARLERVS